MAAVINAPPQFIIKDLQQDGSQEEITLYECNLISDDLVRAWDNARSFSDKCRPRDMIYIGTVIKEFIRGEREFLFYQDINKQYWYECRWKNEKK